MSRKATVNPTTTRPSRRSVRELERRTREILDSELSFRFRPGDESEMKFGDVETRLTEIEAVCRAAGRTTASASVLPVALYLLTADEERALFRDMNFLKYRANVLRSRLDPQQPSGTAIDEVSRLLEVAGRIRELLTECNSRLVIANARHVSNSEEQFEELVSEGFTVLLRAVELFDYSRGFRFSTYLTHSVRRHFYRLVQKHARFRKQQPTTGNEILSGVPDREATPESAMDFSRICNRIMRKGKSNLDNREQLILSCRFGLTGDKPQTLRQIAEGLGLSKERVRQLQMRAIEKLRSAADALNVTIGSIG